MALRLVPMLQARKMVSKTKRVTRSKLKADFIFGELMRGLVDGWAISLLGNLPPPAYFRYLVELPAAQVYKAQADSP